LINQVIFAQLLAIIRHGVIDGDFREDSEASDIADIIVFIFNSIYTTAVYNTGITLASISFENLLNYHLHSICTLQGLKRWEEIKEQLR
jgi:phosphoribosylpyrophosphate synthetase